jgi:hypothetical protein
VTAPRTSLPPAGVAPARDSAHVAAHGHDRPGARPINDRRQSIAAEPETRFGTELAELRRRLTRFKGRDRQLAEGLITWAAERRLTKGQVKQLRRLTWKPIRPGRAERELQAVMAAHERLRRRSEAAYQQQAGRWPIIGNGARIEAPKSPAPSGQSRCPSPEEIERARTPKGGWTREQLAAWGVPWPPPKGWRQALTQRWQMEAPSS